MRDIAKSPSTHAENSVANQKSIAPSTDLGHYSRELGTEVVSIITSSESAEFLLHVSLCAIDIC